MVKCQTPEMSQLRQAWITRKTAKLAAASRIVAGGVSAVAGMTAIAPASTGAPDVDKFCAASLVKLVFEQHIIAVKAELDDI
jgi:hypothetical protein